MFKCPHCGKKGISFWKKFFLVKSPDICDVCGKPITTSFWFTFIVGLITAIAFVVFLEVVNIDHRKGPIGAIGFIIMLFVQALIVPIKKIM